eukprot:9468182-Pyramimonas_sp.AAC.1
MASTNNFIISMTNSFNDLQREIIVNLTEKINEKDKWTKDDIVTLLTEMQGEIKKNKKVKKAHQPRFSPYHTFMNIK